VGVWAKVPSVVIALNQTLEQEGTVVGYLRKTSFKVAEKLKSSGLLIGTSVPPFLNWHRSRGRPPITWLLQICSDCGLSTGDALNSAQDWAVWRKYAMASWALC